MAGRGAGPGRGYGPSSTAGNQPGINNDSRRSGSSGAIENSAGISQVLLGKYKDLEKYKIFLKKRQKEIIRSGRDRELRDDLDDIDFCLECMNVTIFETCGESTLDRAIEIALNLSRKYRPRPGEELVDEEDERPATNRNERPGSERLHTSFNSGPFVSSALVTDDPQPHHGHVQFTDHGHRPGQFNDPGYGHGQYNNRRRENETREEPWQGRADDRRQSASHQADDRRPRDDRMSPNSRRTDHRRRPESYRGNDERQPQSSDRSHRSSGEYSRERRGSDSDTFHNQRSYSRRSSHAVDSSRPDSHHSEPNMNPDGDRDRNRHEVPRQQPGSSSHQFDPRRPSSTHHGHGSNTAGGIDPPNRPSSQELRRSNSSQGPSTMSTSPNRSRFPPPTIPEISRYPDQPSNPSRSHSEFDRRSEPSYERRASMHPDTFSTKIGSPAAPAQDLHGITNSSRSHAQFQDRPESGPGSRSLGVSAHVQALSPDLSNSPGGMGRGGSGTPYQYNCRPDGAPEQTSEIALGMNPPPREFRRSESYTPGMHRNSNQSHNEYRSPHSEFHSGERELARANSYDGPYLHNNTGTPNPNATPTHSTNPVRAGLMQYQGPRLPLPSQDYRHQQHTQPSNPYPNQQHPQPPIPYQNQNQQHPRPPIPYHNPRAQHGQPPTPYPNVNQQHTQPSTPYPNQQHAQPQPPMPYQNQNQQQVQPPMPYPNTKQQYAQPHIPNPNQFRHPPPSQSFRARPSGDIQGPQHVMRQSQPSGVTHTAAPHFVAPPAPRVTLQIGPTPEDIARKARECFSARGRGGPRSGAPYRGGIRPTGIAPRSDNIDRPGMSTAPRPPRVKYNEPLSRPVPPEAPPLASNQIAATPRNTHMKRTASIPDASNNGPNKPVATQESLEEKRLRTSNALAVDLKKRQTNKLAEFKKSLIASPKNSVVLGKPPVRTSSIDNSSVPVIPESATSPNAVSAAGKSANDAEVSRFESESEAVSGSDEDEQPAPPKKTLKTKPASSTSKSPNNPKSKVQTKDTHKRNPNSRTRIKDSSASPTSESEPKSSLSENSASDDDEDYEPVKSKKKKQSSPSKKQEKSKPKPASKTASTTEPRRRRGRPRKEPAESNTGPQSSCRGGHRGKLKRDASKSSAKSSPTSGRGNSEKPKSSGSETPKKLGRPAKLVAKPPDLTDNAPDKLNSEANKRKKNVITSDDDDSEDQADDVPPNVATSPNNVEINTPSSSIQNTQSIDILNNSNIRISIITHNMPSGSNEPISTGNAPDFNNSSKVTNSSASSVQSKASERPSIFKSAANTTSKSKLCSAADKLPEIPPLTRLEDSGNVEDEDGTDLDREMQALFEEYDEICETNNVVIEKFEISDNDEA